MSDTPTVPTDAPGTEDGDDLRHTALIDAHRQLGAKLVGFGGWEMPLSYDEGTIAEHRACREDSIVFDVSHLGTVRVEGPDAFDRLQAALSNDLRRVAPLDQFVDQVRPEKPIAADDKRSSHASRSRTPRETVRRT